jgi:radical SAM protein with 4Fe4S-binding SPASM domain
MDLQQFNSYKILTHLGTIRKFSRGNNPFPVSCEIDPSNLCNHDCLWCYFVDSRKGTRTNLKKETLFSLIDDLAKGGTKSVTLTGGGEPLVNPATMEAIARTHAKGMRVGLVTNGGLLDEGKNKVIVSCCDFVRISLDAVDRKSHSKLHKPHNPTADNFEMVLKNLSSLVALRRKLRKKITIGIGFLVHSDNYRKLSSLASWLKKAGADYLQIRPIFIPGNEAITRVWVTAYKEIRKAIALTDRSFYVFPIKQRYEEIMSRHKNYSCCNIHNLLSVVGADANVYMCSLFRGDGRFSFGSLYENSFAEIWSGKRRKEVLRSFDIRKCPACRYNTYNEILQYVLNPKKPHAEFL